MPGKKLGWIGWAALLLGSSGCCSFWERHCAPAHTAAPPPCVPCCPNYAPPPAYAVPAAAAPAACPAGCAPVGNQWQRPY